MSSTENEWNLHNYLFPIRCIIIYIRNDFTGTAKNHIIDSTYFNSCCIYIKFNVSLSIILDFILNALFYCLKKFVLFLKKNIFPLRVTYLSTQAQIIMIDSLIISKWYKKYYIWNWYKIKSDAKGYWNSGTILVAEFWYWVSSTGSGIENLPTNLLFAFSKNDLPVFCPMGN